MKSIEHENYIQGRSGLKIPVLHEGDVWSSSHILSFFRTLQTINGLNVSKSQGTGKRRQQRSFHNMLMIAEIGAKPLVVIQGSYDPRARSDVQDDLRRNRERRGWGQQSSAVITGKEKHAIHVSPVDFEESAALLEVRRTLTKGGSGHEYWRSEPSVYISGKYSQVDHFVPRPSCFEANQQFGKIAYSDHLKQAMTHVVALLK